MNYFKIYIIILFCVVSTSALKGQTATFLNINPDAHSSAVANSGAALSPNAFSFWNNSASTIFSKRTTEIGVGYTNWQPLINSGKMLSAAGYFKLSDELSLTAGVKNFMHSSYDITGDDGIIVGKYSPKEAALGVGFGVKVLPTLSFSANLNYISSKLAQGRTANAYSADLALFFKLNKTDLGLTIYNLGTRLDYDVNQSYRLPLSIQLGANRTLLKTRISEIISGVQCGLISNEDNSRFNANIRLEYIYNGVVSFRGGYYYGGSDIVESSYATAGMGVEIFTVADLHGSYIFAFTDYPLNETFRLALTVPF